jgi:predicted transcriptional regulator
VISLQKVDFLLVFGYN